MQTVFDVVDNSHHDVHAYDDGSYCYDTVRRERAREVGRCLRGAASACGRRYRGESSRWWSEPMALLRPLGRDDEIGRVELGRILFEGAGATDEYPRAGRAGLIRVLKRHRCRAPPSVFNELRYARVATPAVRRRRPGRLDQPDVVVRVRYRSRNLDVRGHRTRGSEEWGGYVAIPVGPL